MLRAARDLARRGFHVFPCYAVLDAGTERARCSCRHGAECGSPGKHPIGNTARGPGQGGVYAATRDAKALAAWWVRWPHLNPAVRTGVDDLVVLDVDGAAGFETMRRLEGELGQLPPTLTARSGRAEGGAHLWFRAPALASLGSRKVAPGLDLKAAGGYVVAPGARHRSGTTYAWTKDVRAVALPDAWVAWALRAIDEGQAKPPPWERPRFALAATGVEGKAERLLARLASAPEGARNDTLNEVAFTLGGLHAGGQVDDVRQRLFEVAMATGMDEREVTATIRSGWEDGSRKPLLPKPQQSAEEIAAIQAAIKKPAPEAPAARESNRTRQDGSTDGSGSPSTAPPPAPAVDETPPAVFPPSPPRKREPAPWDRKRPKAREPEVDQAILCDLARAAERVVSLLPATTAWDDERDGTRHQISKALCGVLVLGDVSTAAAAELVRMVDRRMVDRDPSLQDALEPVAFYARNTLKRAFRPGSQSNFGAVALGEILAREGVDALEAAGFVNELCQRTAEWARLAPLADELSSFEKDRLAHRRWKDSLVFVLKCMDEQGLAIPDPVRATLAAAIHCSEYAQVHRAECCSVSYAKSSRVCELFFCPWCGPRMRAARAKLAKEKWNKHFPGEIDLTIYELPPGPEEDATKVRRAACKILTGFMRGWLDSFSWFVAPEQVVVLTVEAQGVKDSLYTHSTLDDAASSNHVDCTQRKVTADQAVILVQKLWNERARVVRDGVGQAVLALKKAERGDEAAARSAQRILEYMAEGGWARDARWTGSGGLNRDKLAWPSRAVARAELKKQAEASRGVSAKPPERCPAHQGLVKIDVVHVASARVVVAGARKPVALLDVVRADPERRANVPEPKRRVPKLTPEEAEAVAAWARGKRARMQRL